MIPPAYILSLFICEVEDMCVCVKERYIGEKLVKICCLQSNFVHVPINLAPSLFSYFLQMYLRTTYLEVR